MLNHAIEQIVRDLDPNAPIDWKSLEIRGARPLLIAATASRLGLLEVRDAARAEVTRRNESEIETVSVRKLRQALADAADAFRDAVESDQDPEPYRAALYEAVEAWAIIPGVRR